MGSGAVWAPRAHLRPWCALGWGLGETKKKEVKGPGSLDRRPPIIRKAESRYLFMSPADPDRTPLRIRRPPLVYMLRTANRGRQRERTTLLQRTARLGAAR